MSLKGKFIVFEGGEGTGKTTQIKSLRTFLEAQSYDVVLTWEPGGTRLGQKIRHVLLNPENGKMDERCEALLYSAARAQHVTEVIKPALERGAIVLCDRYCDASRAYQGVARNLGLEAIDQINSWATNSLWPDLVLLFDIDPRKGLDRIRNRHQKEFKQNLDRLEQEDLSFHESVREAYLSLAKGNDSDRFEVLNADQSIEALTTKIHAILEQRFS